MLLFRARMKKVNVVADENNKRRKPLIDDSEPQSEHSLDDDFNDLIRRELGEESPKKKEPEIMITPAREEVKRPEPKIEVVPVKPEPRPEPIIKKETIKPVAKPAPVKKVEIKKAPVKPIPVKKVEPKVVAVKAQPKKVETKAEPRKVERHVPSQPKVVNRATGPVQPRQDAYDDTPRFGKYVAMIIVLVLLAVGVYAVGAMRSNTGEAGLGCASTYVDQRSGVELSWADASPVEQSWLRKAYEESSEAKAAEIFHMLACDDAVLGTLSDPAAYSKCPTPNVYVVVDERTLSENPTASLDSKSVLALMHSDNALKQFTLVYKLAEPDVRVWKIGAAK
jgi:hypothetical protein